MKDEEGYRAVFTEQGSGKVLGHYLRTSWCGWGSAYTQVKMTEAPRSLRMPKEECPEIWIRIPVRQRPKGWNSIEDPVVSLERNFFGHPLASLLWERNVEEVTVEKEWEKVPTWECLLLHKKLGLFLSVFVGDIPMVGKKQNIDCMWKTLQKKIYLEDPTPSFSVFRLHAKRGKG